MAGETTVLQGGKPPQTRDRGEVVHMTVYEAISLMISFGTLIIALLAYIDRKYVPPFHATCKVAFD